MWLAADTETATVIAGVYEIDFPTNNTDRVLKRLVLLGPAGSQMVMYLDTIRYDATWRGDVNSADYFSGVPIPRGRQLRMVWNVGVGAPVPVATIFCDDGETEIALH